MRFGTLSCMDRTEDILNIQKYDKLKITVHTHHFSRMWCVPHRLYDHFKINHMEVNL
jgi:hypothetical protein